jgi:hypothetical protein
MQSLDVERRLSAIVAADVVGYSRLMETEEDATVVAWLAAPRQSWISLARLDREGDSAVTDWKELHGEMIAIDATYPLLDDKSLTKLYREVRGE